MRDKFKKLVPKDADPIEWHCGDDVPVFFTPDELHQMEMRTLRQNRDSGFLTTEQFKEMKREAQIRKKLALRMRGKI